MISEHTSHPLADFFWRSLWYTLVKTLSSHPKADSALSTSKIVFGACLAASPAAELTCSLPHPDYSLPARVVPHPGRWHPKKKQPEQEKKKRSSRHFCLSPVKDFCHLPGISKTICAGGEIVFTMRSIAKKCTFAISRRGSVRGRCAKGGRSAYLRYFPT